MSEYPSACWDEVELARLVSPQRPITYGILKPGPDVPGGIPYVRVVDIQDGQVRVEQLRRTTPEIDRAYRRSRLAAGDLLVSIRGHVGRAAVVPDSLAGANITQDTARLALEAPVEPRFVIWYLASPRAQAWMARHTKGVAVRGINLGDLRRLPVPVPPLPEQRRIAAILDKSNAIRRKRQRAMKLTEDLVQSLFMRLVGPAHPSHDAWPLRTIGSLASAEENSIRTGPFGSDLRHSEFVGEGVAVLGIDNVVNNHFEWAQLRFITPRKYENLKRYTVRSGDVLITIMGTTGRSAVVPEGIPTSISTKHLATITPDRSVVLPEYLSGAIHRDPGVLRQIRYGDRGAIMPGLNLEIVKAISLRLPPMAAQLAFSEAGSRVRAWTESLTQHRFAAKGLFDSLAQDAFNGQLWTRVASQT